MDDKYVLTIDYGTQSVRAMIFNSLGETLAISKVPYVEPYFSKEPGYCEQYPDFYFDKMCLATKEIAKNNKDILSKVAAISMTCFRDTACILDENHKVIRPAIVWLDQRQAKCEKRFPLITDILFRLSGMYETVKLNQKRTVANWLIENEPDNWKKTKYYWALSTYFTYKLTGQETDVPSNYTGHYPINMKTGKWMKKSDLKYCVFGIKTSLLPHLTKPSGLLGYITEDASEKTGLPAGLPLYGAGGDKSCETLGVGANTRTKGSISYGTASSIQVTNDKYIEPEQFLPSYLSPVEGKYNMEVQVYRGYWMLTWFINNFASEEKAQAFIEKSAAEEILNKELMLIPPGSDGLILQPYWGPGLKRPLAKGVVVGFSDYHTKLHLYRSIIEGIGYALKEGLESIEKRQHKKITEIAVSGGGSKSDAICQITADIFNVPVSRVQTYETSSLGCAIIAFTAIGVFKNYDDAIASMVHKSITFYPISKNVITYNELFKKVYKKIYPKMRKINNSIRKCNKSIKERD